MGRGRGRGRARKKLLPPITEVAPGAGAQDQPKPSAVTKEATEEEFWKYFHDKVYEWNPCLGEGEEPRFMWDEEVGAYDLEADLE